MRVCAHGCLGSARVKQMPYLASCERALLFVSSSGYHGAVIKLFDSMVRGGMDVPDASVVAASLSYAAVNKPDTAVALITQMYASIDAVWRRLA